MEKYRLEAFKIILSFIFLIVAGGLIESWHSDSVKKRERELLIFDEAISSFKTFGASLASLRASANRLLNSNYSETHLAFYHASYKEYTNVKLPFAMSMQLSNRGSQADADLFGDLNESIVEMDQCLTISTKNADKNQSCDMDVIFEKFVELSTGFEGVVIESLTK